MVCREGSFTRAADQLFLSPVAVKNQIDFLEDELGEKLFIRKATGCVLTPAGEVFKKHASLIVKQIEKAKTEVEKAGITARGEILAGHSITFNYKFIGALSTGFSSISNNHIIQFEKYPKSELTRMLLKRQLNCVFAEKTLIDDPERHGIEFYPLADLPVYAIMKKEHSLSANDSLSPEQLQEQEIYVSSTLSDHLIDELKRISPDKVKLIEETERNILFNRVIKNAIEIYPKSFSYYKCIPLKTDPVVIGIYILNNSPRIIREMIDFSERFIKNSKSDVNEIM